jgi:DNA-binding NarL/FixJ family response regulator
VIRVQVVDDQPLVRAGLRTIFDAEPGFEVVGEAGDGSDAARVAIDCQPDIVLMDIRLSQMDGIEATRRVLAAVPESKVVMLTTFDTDEHVIDAFAAGASGFLLKTAPPDHLVQGVRTAHESDALIAPARTRALIGNRIQPRSATDAVARLTPREQEVLRALARGLSNAEIAEELTVEASTVKSHVASILAKLGLRDRVHAVVFAYENNVVSR